MKYMKVYNSVPRIYNWEGILVAIMGPSEIKENN